LERVSPAMQRMHSRSCVEHHFAGGRWTESHPQRNRGHNRRPGARTASRALLGAKGAQAKQPRRGAAIQAPDHFTNQKTDAFACILSAQPCTGGHPPRQIRMIHNHVPHLPGWACGLARKTLWPRQKRLNVRELGQAVVCGGGMRATASTGITFFPAGHQHRPAPRRRIVLVQPDQSLKVHPLAGQPRQRARRQRQRIV
jgi:hypothetical protein